MLHPFFGQEPPDIVAHNLNIFFEQIYFLLEFFWVIVRLAHNCFLVPSIELQ